jgi:hypothetical protein
MSKEMRAVNLNVKIFNRQQKLLSSGSLSLSEYDVLLKALA